ncbi:MAG: glycosyltransferase, partial [Desulfomonilaceae bacterium]
LEDREVIDINKQFLGNDPELEKKIRYLGKITNKAYGELPSRNEALDRFGLPNKKTILISLGRNCRVIDLSKRFLEMLERTGVGDNYQVVMVMDPYLDNGVAQELCCNPLSKNVRFLPFVPDLVDLVHHSDLVICRAGYNTVNEILLTGTKAIVIPENHGGGEQELRAQSVHEGNICISTEDEILFNNPDNLLCDILNRPASRVSFKFDKYAVGKSILDDLEDWKARPRPCR